MQINLYLFQHRYLTEPLKETFKGTQGASVLHPVNL